MRNARAPFLLHQMPGAFPPTTGEDFGVRNPAKAYDFVPFAPSLGHISAGNRHGFGEKAKSMV